MTTPMFVGQDFVLRRMQSDWLKHIHDRELHTANVTVAAGTYSYLIPKINNPSGGYTQVAASSVLWVPGGTPMMLSSGKHVPCTHGSTPSGILMSHVDLSSGTDQFGLLLTGFAVINHLALAYESSNTAGAYQTAIVTALAALNIVDRSVV
jgi:hypothetical protein